FGNVDAFPIVLDTKNVDQIVETVANIAPTLGGINLEDISAPRCFEVEQKLKERLNIPVFHDDQHGTAIVVLSGLTNPHNVTGMLKDAMVGADVFIGVSAPNIVSKDMVKTMNKDGIIFAMANPTPEIFPEDAKEAGIAVMGTGRSDYPNQINNVL
ncbi:NAD(P)-dependent malic enzyme, partial [Clostridium paraputrificum]|uniref:NAD(P)-dependent malic enzyme n=1 Tax=Clostridium paraputrificum TaxID=29363 RepID=UPI000AE33CE1